MKKIVIFAVFLFLCLPPPEALSLGINISPGKPQRKIIIFREKQNIENELATNGQFEYEIIGGDTIPEYTGGGRAWPMSTKLELIIRNATTNQTAPFKKGTRIWFEMMRVGQNGNDEEILNSDWKYGFHAFNPYVVLSEDKLSIMFQGAEIVSAATKIVIETESFCLYIYID